MSVGRKLLTEGPGWPVYTGEEFGCLVIPEMIPGLDATHYVSFATGALAEKPDIPVQIDKLSIRADGVDTAVISGFPTDNRNGGVAESKIIIGGQQYVVDDDTVEISVDAPGTYRVICLSVNYKERVFEVEAYED